MKKEPEIKIATVEVKTSNGWSYFGMLMAAIIAVASLLWIIGSTHDCIEAAYADHQLVAKHEYQIQSFNSAIFELNVANQDLRNEIVQANARAYELKHKTENHESRIAALEPRLMDFIIVTNQMNYFTNLVNRVINQTNGMND